jgi:hypothetical protein
MKPSQYAVFRGQALTAQREQLGISAPGEGFPVWGALMEMAVPVGHFSVLALQDGTASVYLSNGAAVIGGGEHESARRAASAVIECANEARGQFRTTLQSASPSQGRVAFYLRTDLGLISAEFPEIELRRDDHPLNRLYIAAHVLLANLREISQRSHRREG